ncbi:hypothetical protein [Streptomyces sp. NPDC097619]|uniref:hypothetical protein n=1 Tax=Streptomyces sp. NPDC097619 TaxID=3157228 RepID=UPI00331CFAA7
MTSRRPGQGRLTTLLTAAAALLAGCTGSVDPDALPGLYREDRTGAELRLDRDGTFSAQAVRVDEDEAPDPADFHGRWEWLGDRAGDDYVYLYVEDGGLGRTGGLQLYPSGRNAMEFRPDPDRPASQRLTRVTAP